MSLTADLRQTWRNARKAPVTTLAVLLTLAIGIGANGAVWSVLRAVLLAPLPYPQPERLVQATSKFPALGFERFWVSAPEFLEYREWNRSFTEFGAYRARDVSVAGSDRPVRVRGAIVSASLFDVLGVEPAIGRVFTAAEDVGGGPPVAVISHRLWVESFAARPEVVGGSILVDGAARTLLGVMPPRFDLDEGGIQIWLPIALDADDRQRRANHRFYLIGRLRPEATLQSARAELDTLVAGWRERIPEGHVPSLEHPLHLEPLHDAVVGNTRPALQALTGAVAFLLLIACTNVANLLLSRAGAREREMAIRAAMGAPRGVLLRQLLVESVVLALAGGALGLAAAQAGVRALLRASPDSLPRSADVRLDSAVLLSSLAVAALAGIAFGLAPALALSRARFDLLLKEGARRRTIGGGGRGRRLLIVVEMALAVALIVGSALMIRTVRSLLAVDTGFDATHLTSFQLFLPPATYPQSSDQTTFYTRLVAALEAVPGVESVGSASGLPPIRDVNASDMEFEGIAPDPKGPPHNVDYWQFASDDWLATMRIGVRSGRSFEPADASAATPVTLINRKTAAIFWPGLDPVGRRLRPEIDGAPWMTIVGVVDDVKQGGIDQKTGTEVYFSYRQVSTLAGADFLPRSMYTVVRSAQPEASIARSIRDAVAAIDPTLPVAKLRTMDEVVLSSIARPRFIALLLSIFAAAALFLAAIGIYGVLSYSVAQRGQELGVRIALGADRPRILRLVVGEGMTLALAGIGAGVAISLALSRLMTSLLFGVAPTDLWTYGGVSALLAAVAIAACAVPAARAARVDPLVVLRSE